MELNELTAPGILQSLDDDLAGPPRADIASAIAEARRRRRVYRMTSAVAVAVATVVALVAVVVGVKAIHAHKTPTGPTHLSCTEQRLPVPHSAQSGVTGADPTGRYVLGQPAPAVSLPVIIWDNGVAHVVSIPDKEQVLVDITSHGVAVGSSYSGTAYQPWIYENGTLSALSGPTDSWPVAIGEQGTIAGTARRPDKSEYPIVWRTPTSTATGLSMPNPQWDGSVDDVDADGTIVGTVRPSPWDLYFQGIVWYPDGSRQLLPLPRIPGVKGVKIISIHKGIIIAVAEVAVADKVGLDEVTGIPVAYDLRTATFDTLTGPDLLVSGGNGRRWLVGTAFGGDVHPPVVWTPGTGIVKLPTLSPPKADNDYYKHAETVSDDGRTIAGEDTDAKGIPHAVVWHCH
jgi:hypothetical protein